jgi:molybdopterin molybdotransferase
VTKLAEAKEMIREKNIQSKTEIVSIEDSLGRYIAEPVNALISFMPHDYSKYDGIAIHHADCDSKGNILVIEDETFAGDEQIRIAKNGIPIAITTGAILPIDCAAVVKQEELEWLDSSHVQLKKKYNLGEGLGKKGMVVVENQLIVDQGDRVNADMIEKMVMGGIRGVTVYKHLRIGILNTGSELIDIEDEWRLGKLYPSNGYYLEARLRELGNPITTREIVKDDFGQITQVMDQMVDSHKILITTGGVGQGNKDLMLKAVNQMGYEIHFSHLDDRTACRNVIFAEKNGHYILCLSGKTHAMKEAFEELGKEFFQ